MKIVIDIPADDFNLIRNGALFCVQHIQHDRLDEVVTHAFNRATIIPKGHGDLIDRDKLIQKQFIPNLGFALVDLDNLKAAPVVIAADRENTE